MLREDCEHPEEPHEMKLQRHQLAMQITAALLSACQNIPSEVAVRHHILPDLIHLAYILFIIERKLAFRQS